MSAVAAVWKSALLKAVHIPARKPLATTQPVIDPVPASPVISLVRQVFLPTNTVRRTRVLFAAADAGTNVFAVCEQAGRALAKISGARVAVVQRNSVPTPEVKKAPGNVGTESWRGDSSRIAENVWRVPAILVTGSTHDSRDMETPIASASLPFDYVLFACSVADNEMPEFCSSCEAAVLVLTANQTHRESAVRAKERLLQCNAEFLGVVLDGRDFPIPEAIYRRL